MLSKMLMSFTILLLFFAVFFAVDTLYSSDSEWSSDQKCVGKVTYSYNPHKCSEYGESSCSGTVSFTRTCNKTCKGTYTGSECKSRTVKGASGTQDCKWNGSSCYGTNQQLNGTLDSCTDRSMS